MTAFHHKRIVDEFRQQGGTLTGPQIAAVVGFGWRRDIHEMRKAGYLVVEDAAGLWHLDLEELPEPDVGGAAVTAHSRDAWEGDGSSPDAGPDPHVEGETPVLFDAPVKTPNPYDGEAA